MPFTKQLCLTSLLLLLSLSALQAQSAVLANIDPANSIVESPSTISLAELSNQDIQLDGNYFGLLPSLSERATPYASDLSAAQKKYLLTCIHDPDRFVLAHVLLSFNASGTVSSSASEWNGLRVELHADGSTEIDPSQMDALAKQWAQED